MAKQQIGVIGLAVMGKTWRLTLKAVDIPLPYITVHAKNRRVFKRGGREKHRRYI